MRVIVIFLFKRLFFRMKSNLNGTSPKRPLGIPKGFLKKSLYILVTVHFHSHSNKRPSGPFKSVTKWTLMGVFGHVVWIHYKTGGVSVITCKCSELCCKL